jgi:hypothetical protein
MRLIQVLLAAGCIALSTEAHAASRDGFVLGLDAVHRPVEDVLGDVADAQALGAGHILIPVLLCQDDHTSTRVEECPSAPDRYVALGRAIRSRGGTVAILPFLVARDGTWRGYFEPSDFEAWAGSYTAALDGIAAVAEAIGAIEFVAGTELNRLYVSSSSELQEKRTRYWAQTLKRYRERLGVPSLLIANWDQWNTIPFWRESDAIGLSSYFPLAGPLDEDTSVEALARRWRAHAEKLAELSREMERPLYFGELGYPSVASAAKEPWSYTSGAPLDLGLQARLFEAFERVWAEPAPRGFSGSLQRFMIWALHREAAPLEDTGYSVLGKPAEAAVSELFKRRSVRAPHPRSSSAW